MNKIFSVSLLTTSILLLLGTSANIGWIVMGEYWKEYKLILGPLAIGLAIGWWLLVYTSYTNSKYIAKARWIWTFPSFSKFCLLVTVLYDLGYCMIGPPWRGFEVYYIFVAFFWVSVLTIGLVESESMEEAENEAEMEDDL